MEKVGDMKFIDFEDVLDRDLGTVGTPKRDEFERKVDESVHAYRLHVFSRTSPRSSLERGSG